MPTFGTKSLNKLQTCHPDIQRVMYAAIQTVDFSVIYGHRGEQDQLTAFEKGHSTKDWPDSKHNQKPSIAIDCLPHPSGWPRSDDSANKKMHRLGHFYYMAGVIMQCSHEVDVALRWGGNWDMDNDFLDQTFDDLAHFEIVIR